MSTFIVVCGVALLTLYIYTDYRKKEELEERNRKREALEKEEEEEFKKQFHALIEICNKFIAMDNLPWFLYKSIIAEDDTEWFDCSDRTFRTPWTMTSWMKEGGLNGDGKECYDVCIDDTFNGRHVKLYFRRIVKPKKKIWVVSNYHFTEEK